MWLLARLASISHRAGAGQRGRQVSWMYGMDNVGRLSGPLVGGFVAAAFGPRSPFVAYAALAALSLIPTVLFAPDIPRRARSVEPESSPPKTLSVREIIIPRLAFFGVAFFSAVARGPIFADMLHLYAAFTYNLDARGIGILATAASLLGLPDQFPGRLDDGPLRTQGDHGPGLYRCRAHDAAAGRDRCSAPFAQLVRRRVSCRCAAQSLTGGSIQTIGADVAPPQARGMFLGLWRFTGQVGQTASPVAFAFLASTPGMAPHSSSLPRPRPRPRCC